MKKALFIFALLFAAPTAFAQREGGSVIQLEDMLEEAFTSAELQQQTNAVHRGEPVSVREFDRSNLKEITGEIDYTEKPREKRKPDKKDSEEKTHAPAVSAPWAGEGLRWIGYIVIIGAILYFVLTIIRNTDSRPTNHRLVIKDSGSVHQVENIEELEIDQLLRQARESGDFRLMIRIQYLALLKTLHTKGLIKWERDKTNREYTVELLSKEVLYHEFRKLTLAYETVWYGEHEIDSAGCELIMSGFDHIQQHLSNRSK